MAKYLIFIVFTFLSLTLPQLPTATASAQNQYVSEVLVAPQPIHTTSRFETKLETQVEKIERTVVIRDDPNNELDNDTVLDEGADGQKTTVWKIYYYEGKEYSQEAISVETIPPRSKIVDHGTKIIWRDMATPDGPVSYWRKLHVWATQYDSHCPGCDQTTATGLHQGKGVIAVDPTVIKLGSRVYIPGYGIAIAGDTGGDIKGSIIDLGFGDTRSSGWISRFVDIYLLGS